MERPGDSLASVTFQLVGSLLPSHRAIVHTYIHIELESEGRNIIVY